MKYRTISILFLIALLLISFIIDETFLKLIISLRLDILNPIFVWFTNFGLIVATILLASFLLVDNDGKDVSLIAISLALALELSFLLKRLFNFPRPYEILNIPNLIFEAEASFPSGHATIAFAIIPLLKGKLEKYRLPWTIFAVIMAFSRMYVGVHFLSDVVGGIILGLGIGWFIEWCEQKYRFVEKCILHINNACELRRQIAHTITGIAIILLIKQGVLKSEGLLIILIVGGICSLLARKYRLPLIDHILEYFEREEHRKHFPGRGSFFLVLGSFLALKFFPQNIALAGIIIMAVGDSIANIAGRRLGRVKIPWSRKKYLEGTLSAIVVSTFAAYFFVPFIPALLASIISMVAETIPWRIGKFEIDDNLIIPIIASYILKLTLL